MSQTGEERVQAFRDAVNASPELQAKVTAEDADWVEIAQAAGHEITAEEVEADVTAQENVGGGAGARFVLWVVIGVAIVLWVLMVLGRVAALVDWFAWLVGLV